MSWKCSGCLLHSHHSDSWEAQDPQNGPNMSERNRMYHIYIPYMYHTAPKNSHMIIDYQRCYIIIPDVTTCYPRFHDFHLFASQVFNRRPPWAFMPFWSHFMMTRPLEAPHHPLKYGWNTGEISSNPKFFGNPKLFGNPMIWSKSLIQEVQKFLSSCGAKQCCKRNETRLQHLKLCPPKSSVISYACELQSPWFHSMS